MCENVSEHQKQTARIAPNSHIHQSDMVNALQSDAVNTPAMKVAVDEHFTLTRLLPSFFPFPVTFEQFKKYTHYEEPLEAIVKNLTQSDPTVYSINLKDSSVEKSRLLHDYYEAFYMRPEIRPRYPLRLRPCPGAMKKKLLKIPFVDDDEVQLGYNGNSPACKRQKITTLNTTNKTQEIQKQKEVTNTFAETETNTVDVVDTNTENLHDAQCLTQNTNITKEASAKSINLIPVKMCYTEAFIKNYIAQNVSSWSEDLKTHIRRRIAAAKDAHNQIQNETNKVTVQSDEILKHAAEVDGIIEATQRNEAAVPATEIIDTIDITSDTEIVKMIPETNYPKHCMLGYVLRMTTGPKHCIVKAILEMSLDEFLQSVHVHSCPETVSTFDLELIYQFAIVEQKIWPLNMYIKLCDLFTYLQKKLVSMKTFNLEHISPKLLYWKDLIEYTDYDKCVNLDYFKNTGDCIRNAKLLHERRIDYYKRCWLYEQWIWRVPQLTHKQLHAELQIALDLENSTQNLLTEDESTIPFGGATVLSLEEYYKRKATAANITPTKITTRLSAANAITPTTSRISTQIRKEINTPTEHIEDTTKTCTPTTTKTPSTHKTKENEKMNVYVVSYEHKKNDDNNTQMRSIVVEDNANQAYQMRIKNNNSNNTYMQLQETKSKITSTQQILENEEDTIPFVQIPMPYKPINTQTQTNAISTQSPNLFVSGSTGSQTSQSTQLHNYSFVNMPNTQDQIAALPEDHKDMLQLPETYLASSCANAAKYVEPIIKEEFTFLKNLQFIIDTEQNDNNEYICLPLSEQIINVLDDSVQDYGNKAGLAAVQRITYGDLGSLVNSPPPVADDQTYMPEVTQNIAEETLQSTVVIENVNPTQHGQSTNTSSKNQGTTFKLLPITLLDSRSGKVIRIVQHVSKTTKVSDNVPQLTHKFRALPTQILNTQSTSNITTNKPQTTPTTVTTTTINPTTSTTVDGMTVSQALAADSTFFNTQFLNAIATATTTQPPTSTSSSSEVTAAPKNTATNQVNDINQYKRVKYKSLLYYKLLDFHYFREVTEEHVAKYAIQGNGIGKRYMQATISSGRKYTVYGSGFLQQLFSHCTAQQLKHLYGILDDLQEYHYNRFNRNVNNVESDLRLRVLSEFLDTMPVFNRCQLEFDDATCAVAQFVRRPRERTTTTGEQSLISAINPSIRERMAHMKIKRGSANSFS